MFGYIIWPIRIPAPLCTAITFFHCLASAHSRSNSPKGNRGSYFSKPSSEDRETQDPCAKPIRLMLSFELPTEHIQLSAIAPLSLQLLQSQIKMLPSLVLAAVALASSALAAPSRILPRNNGKPQPPINANGTLANQVDISDVGKSCERSAMITADAYVQTCYSTL